MNSNRRETNAPRADGGRRMPGVPSDPEPEPDPDEETEADEAENRTASGRRMPSVPKTPAGASTASDEPSGESCGSGETADTTPENDLTTAISLASLRRVRDPASVIQDAKRWSDWVGVVGEASGPELNQYFRSHSVDVDFFNDVADGPADRLAKIDEGHHFYSERRVLVGLPEEREWAERAGWEFQPFETVAEDAGWPLAEE